MFDMRKMGKALNVLKDHVSAVYATLKNKKQGKKQHLIIL